jgi:hypothetical protein
MGTDLEIETELCGMVLVLPCDVTCCVNRVEVIGCLFLNQYALLLVGVNKKWYPATHPNLGQQLLK